MFSRISVVVAASLFWLSAPAHAIAVDAASYGFPLSNPFVATIATTPAPLQPQDLPQDKFIDQSDFSLSLHPDREFTLPDEFWAVKKFKYRLARQHQAAPLIFIIAGTGSDYAAGSMEFLKRVYYQAGYHVVQLSSPTSYDFMSAASRFATPGFSREDARDLYRVMQEIRNRHPDVEVTRYLLTGYSLGGLHAGFVSQLDSINQVFDFKRVLMINPPVNLFASVGQLDKLVNVSVRGVSDTQTFYDHIFSKLATFFRDRGGLRLDAAMLYEFQQSEQGLTNEEMAMLIGTVFRFAASDIVFTSDLVNQRGLIVPPGKRLTNGTSLTPYFAQALQCNFNCYIRTQLLPFWRKRFDGEDIRSLIEETGLAAIEEHLRDNPRIAVMTNADDLILVPGDLAWLRAVFADRLTVYPSGGHLGNMNYRRNVADMLAFFHE